MKRLQGKVALVTGASRGQGRSHAVRLAEEGADVIALDLCDVDPVSPYSMGSQTDLGETARLVEGAGGKVFAQKADVRDLDALAAAAAAGVAELGRLDIVVPNAGIVSYGLSHELSVEAWEDVIAVNQTGVWKTCKAGIPHLLEHGEGGSIVIINSTAGLHGAVGLSHYVTAKTGLLGLARALALELGPHNIRVNSVHPTMVDTPMVMNDATIRMFVGDDGEPSREQMVEACKATHALPLPWIEPVDVSNAVVFLASDEARYITGASLPVDLGNDLKG
jgi:SDR family mycofactocin-dependent oxidoreductase